MQSLNGDEQRQILGEVLASQLQAILEYVSEMPRLSKGLGRLETKVERMDARLAVVETVIKQHEIELRDIKRQLIRA